MSQQGPSRKIKTTKKKTYAKPGTLSSLVQQRRTFLTTQETLQAVRLEKKNLLKSIEKEQPIAKQQRVAQLVEANEQCVEEQAIVDEQPIEEEQLQVDSTSTLPTNEQSEEQASDPSTQKNKRGTTQMQRVHGRNERKLILLNNNNQPVGPTNDVVLELSSFLGTLARNATLCPLDILDWRYMDTKDDLWTYTQGKYDIPEDAREWALDVIGYAWRRHKFELKKVCYKSSASEEAKMAKRPPYVPECQLKELIKYWDSDKHKSALVQIQMEYSCKAVMSGGSQHDKQQTNSFIQKEREPTRPLKNLLRKVCKGPGPCKTAYVKGRQYSCKVVTSDVIGARLYREGKLLANGQSQGVCVHFHYIISFQNTQTQDLAKQNLDFL
uniref:Ubiquitin n=1 Tax=Solanum tuberosum TaxID=4113 RepID=M1DZ21_SOLTU